MKYTYLIKGVKGYKIGQSINPEKRLSQLKTANPNIKLLAYGKGVTEKQLHTLFKNKRTKLEWFDLKRKDVEITIKLLKNEYNPKDINYIKYSTYVIDFGKYKGYPITEMKTNEHINYINWFLKNTKNKYLKKVFRWRLSIISIESIK